MDELKSLIEKFGALVIDSPGCAGESPQEKVRRAFANPVGGLGLECAVFSGDRVVVVVPDRLPEADGLLLEIGRILARQADAPESAANSEGEAAQPAGPAFLFASGRGQSASDALPLGNGQNMRILLHDPSDDNGLALLAPGCDEQPLTVNRALFDADVVILLTCPAPEATSGSAGAGDAPSGIWPLFGSADAERELARRKPARAAMDRLSVDRNLWINAEICVVTGPGGTIHEVLFGQRQEVRAAAMVLLSRLWQWEPDRSGDLVVATIETGDEQAGWRDFRHALLVADALAADAAPVVIWSPLVRLPEGRVREELADSFGESPGAADSDSPLGAILARRPVFLHSGLERAAVEDLGLGHLESLAELEHLRHRASRPVLVRDAHRYPLPASSGQAP